MQLLDYHSFSISDSYDKFIWGLAENNMMLILPLGYYLGVYILVIYALLWLRTQYNVRHIFSGLIFLILVSTNWSLTMLFLFSESGRLILYNLPEVLQWVWNYLKSNSEFMLLSSHLVHFYHHPDFNQILTGYQPAAVSDHQLVEIDRFVKEFRAMAFAVHKDNLVFKINDYLIILGFIKMRRLPYLLSQESFDCVVCRDTVPESFTLPCKHKLCLQCTVEWFSRSPECPFCRFRS